MRHVNSIQSTSGSHMYLHPTKLVLFISDMQEGLGKSTVMVGNNIVISICVKCLNQPGLGGPHADNLRLYVGDNPLRPRPVKEDGFLDPLLHAPRLPIVPSVISETQMEPVLKHRKESHRIYKWLPRKGGYRVGKVSQMPGYQGIDDVGGAITYHPTPLESDAHQLGSAAGRKNITSA